MMIDKIENIVKTHFPLHPFDALDEGQDFKKILEEYLAMSQAFPYLQAGSMKDLIFYHIKHNIDIPLDIELTSIVGTFLCWDEMGGLYPTIAQGLKALPRILETRRFHYNLLKTDLLNLGYETIKPNYSERTSKYLEDLFDNLADLDKISRAACMISFEHHAFQMISALWKKLISKFGESANNLVYFKMHVGGDDPAEIYHVEMTNRLISNIVSPDKEVFFLERFKSCYQQHVQWCKEICLN